MQQFKVLAASEAFMRKPWRKFNFDPLFFFFVSCQVDHLFSGRRYVLVAALQERVTQMKRWSFFFVRRFFTYMKWIIRKVS